ncbi:kelch repeat [Fusarium beomiforme]|uniref:Kelch repeat n=1 Tax=Fusarium beomiforme TaxID=44412 RepID=A0A9P5AJ29_9HYPO|nr:kelch repeat [Fusarium beomiforme]
MTGWYAGGNVAKWDNDDVSNLFTFVPVTTPQPTDGSNSGSDSTGSSTSTPAGAIAGGIIGGIAAIGVVVGILVWMRRRKRKPSDQPTEERDGGNPSNKRQWGEAELSAGSSQQNGLQELVSNRDG